MVSCSFSNYSIYFLLHISRMSVLVCEIVMIFIFLFGILGATDTRAPTGFEPIIGAILAGLVYKGSFEKE